MNERFSTDESLENKYRNDFLKQQNSYIVRGSYWNNDFHFYGTFVDTFMNSGALMVKACGCITRIPGSAVAIIVDRGQEDMMADDPKQYEDIQRRYKGLEGMWFVAKSHHYIKPHAQKTERYRQTLTLVRNFNYPHES